MPVDRFAIQLFLNGGVRHRRGGRRTMPVLFAWRKPYDIARTNLFDRSAPSLRATGT